ncbi:hypothetical protein [Bryobacter aggregatus]|uniref:hypothetical protein n=1 Tax=Bryobacter aggregatus TaxID=360054 RepID=UPI0006909330|nr:hypothetical protein [Bryobacter aggregatus]
MLLFPGRRRILSAVSPDHIYGYLWTVLLPSRLHLQVLDLRVLGPEIIRPGDLIVGHPGLWFRLAEFRWPTDVWAIHSGGAATPDSIAAIQQHGLARWLDIYGSTETAGVGMREDPSRPYALLPYWPDFLEGIEAPDHIEWSDARHFRLAGRRDRAVQVSGVNVYPQKVEAILRQCPGVRELQVRLMRPEEGRRLKAFVVGDCEEAVLREWASASLSGPERPETYTFGAELPLRPDRKSRDW